MGENHVCLTRYDGNPSMTSRCWGRNDLGQLGLGDSEHRGDGPGEMGSLLPLAPAGATLAMNHASCTGINPSSYECWGAGAFGIFGLGTPDNIGDQAGEPPVPTPYVFVANLFGEARFSDHLCEGMAATSWACWGRNQSGQLGQGTASNYGDGAGETTRVSVPGVAGGASVVSSGRAHSCASVGPNQVACWGANASGQLGLGHTESIGDQPGEMAALAPTTIVVPGNMGTVFSLATSPQGDFNCVYNTYGVACWGANASGQLGLGHTNNIGDDPGEESVLDAVDLGASQFTVSRVTLGRAHACATLEQLVGDYYQTRVKCWGDNSQGQLGLGDTENRGDDPGEMGGALPFVPVN